MLSLIERKRALRALSALVEPRGLLGRALSDYLPHIMQRLGSLDARRDIGSMAFHSQVSTIVNISKSFDEGVKITLA